MTTNNEKSNNWQVAEVQVSYTPTHNKTLAVTSSESAHNISRTMWDKDLLHFQEQIGVLFLNTRNEVLGFRNLHTGALTESVVDLRLLFSLCCKTLATKIIIAHNHPTGTTVISNADRNITRRIKEVGKLLNITLLDHIILADDKYVSFCDSNELNLA